MFDHKDQVSQRQAARRFNCDQSMICKTLKKYTQIRVMKKERIPKRTEKQSIESRKKCGEMYKNYKTVNWVIDDESYFTLTHSSINGNNRYYTSDKELTPSNVRYSAAAKYQSKVLVWLCFSQEGISKQFYLESGYAVNQEVYLNECIKKRLLPFLKKYHEDRNYIFWPDLASSHYAKSVTNFMDQNQINYIKKKENPANVPECRPIENFWAILKGLVYQNNWQASSIEALKTRIQLCIKKIDQNLVKKLAESIPSRLNNVQRNGFIEIQ
ncbi:hypothetical protein ABPG72_020064 [Tetrahymena utriculariae]